MDMDETWQPIRGKVNLVVCEGSFGYSFITGRNLRVYAVSLCNTKTKWSSKSNVYKVRNPFFFTILFKFEEDVN